MFWRRAALPRRHAGVDAATPACRFAYAAAALRYAIFAAD